MRLIHAWLYSGCALLAACGTQPIKPSDMHLQRAGAEPVLNTAIPQPVRHAIPLPPPKNTPKAETYSVVVSNVPAREILFALARDAKINLDIHPGIQGSVTLNAINQTLLQILSRIAKQVDMRYELDGPNLVIMPDAPYLRHYKIDYVNMARDAEGSIANTTQVGSGVAGSTASASNNSSLIIRDASRNRFWETLTQNIKDILHETDKILPTGSSETIVQQNSAVSTTGTGVQPTGTKKQPVKGGIENSPNPAAIQEGGTTVTHHNTFREAASVIANPENGIITVRATGKQHEKIQEFIDQVMASARRQVLIEATVVEVHLNDQYHQGIDWSGAKLGAKGFTLSQAGTSTLPSTLNQSMFILDYANPASRLGSLTASVSLLESFGTVKVLSSPKLSVMNNQTAMLRVVDNLVYFTIQSNTTTNQTSAITTYSTTPNTVPIGFTMSVTPQISDSGMVLFNLRPSITRLLDWVNDPNPDLANAHVTSRIPITSTREMESVIKIASNQIAVMGGLMQDEADNSTDAIPGVSNLPLAGNLFKNRKDTTQKTELVIFLRPVVIRDASINGDYSEFRDKLPSQDFFKPDTGKNNISSNP